MQFLPSAPCHRRSNPVRETLLLSCTTALKSCCDSCSGGLLMQTEETNLSVEVAISTRQFTTYTVPDSDFRSTSHGTDATVEGSSRGPHKLKIILHNQHEDGTYQVTVCLKLFVESLLARSLLLSVHMSVFPDIFFAPALILVPVRFVSLLKAMHWGGAHFKVEWMHLLLRVPCHCLASVARDPHERGTESSREILEHIVKWHAPQNWRALHQSLHARRRAGAGHKQEFKVPISNSPP